MLVRHSCLAKAWKPITKCRTNSNRTHSAMSTSSWANAWSTKKRLNKQETDTSLLDCDLLELLLWNNIELWLHWTVTCLIKGFSLCDKLLSWKLWHAGHSWLKTKSFSFMFLTQDCYNWIILGLARSLQSFSRQHHTNVGSHVSPQWNYRHSLKAIHLQPWVTILAEALATSSAGCVCFLPWNVAGFFCNRHGPVGSLQHLSHSQPFEVGALIPCSNCTHPHLEFATSI